MIFELTLFILFAASAINADDVEVDYYVDLITKKQQMAKYYKFSENAYEFNSPPEVEEFGEFDYVVVGVGSSGSVVASRLSEREDWNILAIEAGRFENNFTDIPNMYFPVEFSKYNWGYTTVPQKTACLGMVHQKCPIPRGKAVGGSSVIDGLIYARGNRLDYDRWEQEGNPGWSYKDVLPFFKKSESSNIPNPDPEYHGENGPLNVEFCHPFSPQLYAFLEANLELNRTIIDYNGKDQIGVSPAQLNIIHGRRDSVAKAFIKPAIRRKNLKVLTGSYVTKILIDNSKVAYGVEFSKKNRRYVVRTKKEVILTAGPINSPHILMLSGVGPKKHLEQHKIPIIEDLQVGQHLLHHPGFYGLQFQTNISTPVKSLKEYVKQFLSGYGPLSIPGNNQGLAYLQTPLAKTPGQPDLELVLKPSNSTNEFSQRAFRFTNSTAEALWGGTNPAQTFFIVAVAVNAISEGSIKLKSSNPFDHPEIDANMLSDPENKDIDTIYEGIKIAMEIIDTDAFKRINTTYSAKKLPACKDFKFMSKDYWYCAIRQLTMDMYHPAGTCRMGPDAKKGAVVDNKLRVHGIQNLRIADTSVLPFTISGHPTAIAVMIGERVSDFIRNENNEISRK